jgi:hypothetical protein
VDGVFVGDEVEDFLVHDFELVVDSLDADEGFFEGVGVDGVELEVL